MTIFEKKIMRSYHLCIFFFLLLLCVGCRPLSEDVFSSYKMPQSFYLTKAGGTEDNNNYGQFPTNPYYASDSIYPLLTLSNGLVVKSLSDSLYLFEGDMLFTKSGLEMLSQLDTSTIDNSRGATIISSLPSPYYWTAGIVPYKMNISLPPSYRSTVVQAIHSISSRAPISFKLMSNNSNYTNYIVFKYSATGNDSFVGQQGGAQEVNINDNDEATIIHEIMHALGFFHEQSRADRDYYIDINTSNIRPEKLHNFNKYNVSYSGVDLGPFDFNSIMLYSSYINDTTFVYDTSIPVMTKHSDGSTWYPQDTLSTGDIDAIWTVYGQPSRQLTREVLNHNISNEGNIYFETYLENTVISFYTDNTYSTPLVLSHPARLYLTRTYTHINNLNHLVTEEDTVTIICQPGRSSYTVSSRPNLIYMIDGVPYQYDVMHYSL